MLEAREGYNIYMCKVNSKQVENWYACNVVQNQMICDMCKNAKCCFDQTLNVFLSWTTNIYFNNELSTNDVIT